MARTRFRHQCNGPADAHALIIGADCAWAPSGLVRLAKPVDSIDKLLKLIKWADLQPAGFPPQVWLLNGACVALGWGPDAVDPGDEEDYTEEELVADRLRDDVRGRLDEVTRSLLGPYLVPENEDRWELFTPTDEIGHRLQLSYRAGDRKCMVDVFLEGWAWTSRAHHDRRGILGSESAGTLIDADNDLDSAKQLGHRLTWFTGNLGVLPGNTAARTGSVLADKVWRDRRKKAESGSRSPGPYPLGPCPMPPIDLPDGIGVEPPISWTRTIDNDEIDDQTQLVSIDQRASYLASAGMIELGLGPLSNLAGTAAEHAAFEDKLPFGLWQVTLPATDSLPGLPDKLPPPHPRMLADQDVRTWVTTETLTSLTADIASGGAGLEISDLAIDEAWITDKQGMALKSWKETLAKARKAALAEGDLVMKGFVGEIYQAYLGRIVREEFWQRRSLAHHHQPLWRASIIAHARHRNRAKAMKVYNETGLWPVRGFTDAWTYLAPPSVKLDDELDYLGKFAVEKTLQLGPEEWLALLGTTSPSEVAEALRQITDETDEQK